jgi:hypothetical protein
VQCGRSESGEQLDAAQRLDPPGIQRRPDAPHMSIGSSIEVDLNSEHESILFRTEAPLADDR